MKNEYNLHTSEHIRSLGKDKKPPRKLVGMRMTVLCLALALAGYAFVTMNANESTVSLSSIIGNLSINAILLIIAGALVALCVLVSVLIKVISNKHNKTK